MDDSCGIGTANFDNRSFRLNFEITMLFAEPSIVEAVEKMFEADFARSTRAIAADYTARPWWFRLAARTCRLMVPVQQSPRETPPASHWTLVQWQAPLPASIVEKDICRYQGTMVKKNQQGHCMKTVSILPVCKSLQKN